MSFLSMLAVFSNLSVFFEAFSKRNYWKMAELFLDLLFPNNKTYRGLKRGYNFLTKILALSTLFTSPPNNLGLFSSDLTTVSCTFSATYPYSPLIVLSNKFYQRMYYLQRTCNDQSDSKKRFGPKFAPSQMPEKHWACLGNESCQEKDAGTCCCMPTRILNAKELENLLKFGIIYEFLWVFRHCTTEQLCHEVVKGVCVSRDKNVPIEEKPYRTKHYLSYQYWP